MKKSMIFHALGFLSIYWSQTTKQTHQKKILFWGLTCRTVSQRIDILLKNWDSKSLFDSSLRCRGMSVIAKLWGQTSAKGPGEWKVHHVHCLLDVKPASTSLIQYMYSQSFYYEVKYIQMRHVMWKAALCHMRTTKAQISLRIRAVCIRAVWSAP